MTFAATATTIEDLLAEDAERIARRDHLRNLVAESDVLMGMLERRNLRGQEETSSAIRRRLVALYRTVLGEELDLFHVALWQTQAALEHLYEAQDALFDRLHPWRISLRALERGDAEEVAG